jgi:MFS family permease
MTSAVDTESPRVSRFRPHLDLAPLRVRSFRLLVAGQSVSEFGNAFQVVALPLLIFAHGGNAARIGLVVAAYGLGRLVTTPVAGGLVDRYGAWRIMMISDVGRMLLAAALAAVAATGHGGALLVGALAAPIGLLAGLFMPAEWSVMPSVLPAEQLHEGNSLNTTATLAAGLVGPSVAGVVVAFADSATAFGIDAATFAVSVLTLLAMGRVQPTAPRTAPKTDGSRPTTVIELLRASPMLRNILVVTVVANLSIGGLSRVALPALATDQLKTGAEGLGALIAAFAGGSLVGGLFAAGFAGIRSRGRGAMLSGLLLAVSVTLVPLAGVAGAVALLFVAGAAATVTNVLVVTTLQKGTPPELMGRTMSLLVFCGVGLFPVSVAVIGFLVDDYGSRSFFFITGASLLVAFCFGLSRRAIRATDTD